MNDNRILTIFLALGGMGLTSQFLITRSRHKKSYRNYLEPILNDHNLRYISSTFPGWFNVGPFPKIEGKIGRPQSTIPFIGQGEYHQYRIVEVLDSQENTYQLWALLDFEIFGLRRIRWRVFPHDSFPDEAKVLLENHC